MNYLEDCALNLVGSLIDHPHSTSKWLSDHLVCYRTVSEIGVDTYCATAEKLGWAKSNSNSSGELYYSATKKGKEVFNKSLKQK